MNIKSIFKGLRSFLILWSSQTVSALGTAMTEFALTIWVYEQNESEVYDKGSNKPTPDTQRAVANVNDKTMNYNKTKN